MVETPDLSSLSVTAPQPITSMSMRYSPSNRQTGDWLSCAAWMRRDGSDWLVRLVSPRAIRRPCARRERV